MVYTLEQLTLIYIVIKYWTLGFYVARILLQ